MLGYVIGGSNPDTIPTVIFGAFIWVILLNSGCFAYNTYYDKDEGSIVWLENPPRITKNLLLFSVVLMLLGQLLSFLINPYFVIIYFIFFVLSISYSHPVIRFKSRPILGLLTNIIGYGVLTVLAGWIISERISSTRIFLMLILTSLSVVLAYTLHLLRHRKEDEKRGYTTFVMVLGRDNTFMFLIISCILGFFIALYMLINGFLRPLSTIGLLPGLYIWFLLFKLKNNPRMDDTDTWLMQIFNAGTIGWPLVILGELFG
jgi:1,4-dihydroxy-2-naphthoate octaprenyltransferase